MIGCDAIINNFYLTLYLPVDHATSIGSTNEGNIIQIRLLDLSNLKQKYLKSSLLAIKLIIDKVYIDVALKH